MSHTDLKLQPRSAAAVGIEEVCPNLATNWAVLLVDPMYQRRIVAIARKYTRGTALCWEDAAQAAHIKVLHAVNMGKFRYGEAPEFFRWAATIARCEIIDLVRRERLRYWYSLDQPLVGTDLTLLETVADDFNLLDTVERSDLLFNTLKILRQLHRQHPEREYLQLWQGRVEGKNQAEIATELGLTQGTVSKRWKELVQRLADALGLLQEPRRTPAFCASRVCKTRQPIPMLRQLAEV
ncbi:MAG TPA: sigma-70 family RNA polymerase sigma factor [Stenomitos sp.]